jgi:hypothetical protein
VKHLFRAGLTAVLVCVFTASLTTPAVFAQDRKKLPEKHDSNTLHKIGKAIQYPIRKAGENTSKTAHKSGKAVQYSTRKVATNASITAHQATGKNSVVKKKSHATGRRVKRVVTPSGHVRVLRPHEKKK